jgi:hypothetical protein
LGIVVKPLVLWGVAEHEKRVLAWMTALWVGRVAVLFLDIPPGPRLYKLEERSIKRHPQEGLPYNPRCAPIPTPETHRTRAGYTPDPHRR